MNNFHSTQQYVGVVELFILNNAEMFAENCSNETNWLLRIIRP